MNGILITFLIVVFFHYCGILDKIRDSISNWLTDGESCFESFTDILYLIQKTDKKLNTFLYLIVWFVINLIECVACLSFWIISITSIIKGYSFGISILIGGLSFFLAPFVLQILRFISALIQDLIDWFFGYCKF